MESIEEFYHHKLNTYPANIYETIGQFNVFRIEERMKNNKDLPQHIRRNFFKIMLFSGENTFTYGHQKITINGNTLLFFHPDTAYSYLPLSSDTEGYFCIFRSEFFQGTHQLQLDQLPLFNTSIPPVFALSENQYKEAKHLFIKMSQEAQGDYIYKYDLIRNYVSELYYLAMKWAPPVHNTLQFGDAGKRITSIFSELLEQQFPIQYKTDTLTLRQPKNYAEKLSIHVNYLNRCIKKTTGKTTGEHIFERIGTEAKILLRDTDWTISEISEALGFDDLAHFNKFFKKQTGINPSSFRLV